MFSYNFLQYLSDKILETKLEQVILPKNFKPELSHKYIMNVDQTIANMKKIASNTHIYVTNGIIVDSTASPDKPNSVESVIFEFINELKNNKHMYVYCAINSTDSIVSHQNWICIDYKNRELIRFEPNKEYPQFRIEEICLKICKYLGGFTYKMYINFSINPYGACRILSTILAMAHVYNIQSENFKVLKGNKNFVTKFIYIVQNELSEILPIKKKYSLRIK